MKIQKIPGSSKYPDRLYSRIVQKLMKFNGQLILSLNLMDKIDIEKGSDLNFFLSRRNIHG
ncbi:MAG TPA: hypothetical protein DD706_01025 [Nitrospiraceae bacterium]|nr:hypothetical protein [Nitrospiraceae bacterium]